MIDCINMNHVIAVIITRFGKPVNNVPVRPERFDILFIFLFRISVLYLSIFFLPGPVPLQKRSSILRKGNCIVFPGSQRGDPYE